jgi:hypothetical protein
MTYIILASYKMKMKGEGNEQRPVCAVLCCAVLCCAVLCCAVLCHGGLETRWVDIKNRNKGSRAGDSRIWTLG